MRFLFLWVLRCVTSPRSLNPDLCIQPGQIQINSGLGCPIRKSSDRLVCSSPKLIAAYHVLHRLSAPRHPPYTLSNLPALIHNPEAIARLPVLNAPRFTAWQKGEPENKLQKHWSKLNISLDTTSYPLSLYRNIQLSKNTFKAS